MTGDGRRHLLVVAPQCASMRHLDRLKEAATALHGALIDSRLGGCEPGLPHNESLITGDDLTDGLIRAAVSAAIQGAAEHRATLVLALLGHGFVPGSTSTLYLMGRDSTDGATDRAVNVGELLAAAANNFDIPGVVGIIDTCHAAGALPQAQDLTAGPRNGRSRLALLTASSVNQQAKDLSFSRALAGVIRAGLPGAGAVLGVRELLGALRGTVAGQDVTGDDHDGDPFGTGPLWIARNAGHHESVPGSLLGPLAKEELAAAFGALPPAEAAGPGEPTEGPPFDLESARESLNRLKLLARSSATNRAMVAVDYTLIALRTVEFLREHLGSKLTTARLRRALRAQLAAEQRTLTPAPAFTDVAIVDRLVFDHPMGRDGCRPSVAEFVVRLVKDAGQDPGSPELRAWAQSVAAQQEVNDAVERAAEGGDDSRLRLVISFASSLSGGWPETVNCWLFQDDVLLERRDADCPTVDRRGGEAAVEDAVAWALEHAESLDVTLRRLDIALPSGLLLDWRPEEAGDDARYGVQYDVVLHWSRRLTPDPVLRRIQGTVQERWRRIDATTSEVPVDWLAEGDTAARDVLHESLRNGRYRRGIGLIHHAGLDDQLLEILLTHTPVLLWPRGAKDFLRERHGCLSTHWWTMPESLGHVYRLRWRGEEAGDFADLRAVWDDGDWLRFCRVVRTAIPPVQSD